MTDNAFPTNVIRAARYSTTERGTHKEDHYYQQQEEGEDCQDR
jgi:hypothetical protein